MKRFVKRYVKRRVKRYLKKKNYLRGKKVFNRAAKRARRSFVKVSRGGIRL